VKRALLLGAVLLAAPLQAQQTRDTTRAPAPPPIVPKTPARDSVVARAAQDSLALRDSIPLDTIKDPIAVAPRPALPEIRGRRTTWDRDAIFASGALTLPELLAQVPGATMFNAGFIAAPTAVSWYGQPGRIRVFLDGVELDAIDLREGNVRDLGVIQLWPLEEVAVERAAGELRVFLRSWRVDRTTAQTRTDITTGSEQANLYRGFFGKRMQSGGVLQLAAQQYSTTSVRTAGDGDALAAFGRVGLARGRLTVDAVGTRFGRNRAPTFRNVVSGTLDNRAVGAFKGTDAVGYVRAAWGDADSTGFWAQALWSGQVHEEKSDSSSGTDTLRAVTQYVAMAGVTRWGARLSATARYRVLGGAAGRLAPSVRASWARDRFAVSTSAEEGGPDSTRRLDAVVSVTPFSWLHLLAAHSSHTPEGYPGSRARETSRGEAAVRLFDRWVSVGAVQRSAALMLGMRVFDTLYVDADVPNTTGLEAGLSGRIWGPFWFEWRGIQWSGAQPYTPEVESHGEIRVAPDFSRRFKRGTFDLVAGLTHEYRGGWIAPVGATVQQVQGAGFVGGYVEMRIGTAHIFWYNRNATGKVYETVPGYLMPRLVQLYGLRWEFWN
jgi:hypothetical protein